MELAEVEEREIKRKGLGQRWGGEWNPRGVGKDPPSANHKRGEGIRKVGAFQYIKNWGGVAPAWRDIRKPGQ